jgi:predicted lipopolysaccharide heptosyltransferase III
LSAPARILVLSIRAIGDMVLVTPAIRALKEAHPQAELTVVAEAFAADVFEGNPHIAALLPIDRAASRRLPWHRRLAADLGWLARIRRGRYDAVVDLFTGPRSAQMARASGAPRRIAEAVRSRRGFYTETVAVAHEGKHLVEQKMQIVAPLTGPVAIPPAGVFLRGDERAAADEKLARAFAGRPAGPLVGLFPGAGWAHKMWPADRYAALGDRLAADGMRVVLIGGPRDEGACAQVAGRMASAPVTFAGIARLRDAMALIDRMALFVGNDTGPTHISAGLGRPTICRFGPADYAKYRLWGDRCATISAHLPCSPCPQQEDTCHRHGVAPGECMARIAVDTVYEKAAAMVEGKRAAPGGAGEAG